MKSIFRSFIYNLICLYLAALIVPGFIIHRDLKFLAIAGVVFTLLNFFLKPLIKILFFPINLLTLGLFAWIVNVVILYILIFFVPQIRIIEWNFAGLVYSGFAIPAIHFTKFMTIVLTSFILSLLYNFLNWLGK
jgi:putative membrane protein